MRAFAALALVTAAGACGPWRRPTAAWPTSFGRGSARAAAALKAGRTAQAAAAVAALEIPADAAPAARAGMLLRRGELRSALGDFAGEEADDRGALAAAPESFDALARLTQFLREHGRPAESLEYADRLVALTEGVDPGNRAEQWLQRAESLLRLGRFDAATADVDRALAAKPDDVPSLWLRIQIDVRAGRAAAARTDVERMIAAAPPGPSRARAYAQRAALRASAGDRAGAESDAARAVAEAPRDDVALEALALRRMAQGRLDEAVLLADRMVEAARGAPGPRRAVLLRERAQIRSRRGDAAGAAADRRAADAADPSSAGGA